MKFAVDSWSYLGHRLCVLVACDDICTHYLFRQNWYMKSDFFKRNLHRWMYWQLVIFVSQICETYLWLLLSLRTNIFLKKKNISYKYIIIIIMLKKNKLCNTFDDILTPFMNSGWIIIFIRIYILISIYIKTKFLHYFRPKKKFIYNYIW